jgi:hypothetical protein
MIMHKRILVTPLVAVLAAGTSGAFMSAQDLTSAVLAGTVTGSNNKPLRGARVYVTSPTLLTPRDNLTGADGTFRINLLPPGRYTITYSLDGYVSRKSEITLIAGIVANGSIKLRPMEVQGETIEIVAGAAADIITPDKTDTSVQTAFTTNRLEEIGGGRGVAALQNLTPGINGTLTNSAGFSIRGNVQRGNKVLQDGQMVNDVLLGSLFDAGTTIEDLIESIAIVQSPLNAKLGNTDGGLISITTKRGGNTFSGSLRYTGQRGGNSNIWTAYNLPYPDNRGAYANISNPGDDNFSRTWQFSVMGPIVPNYLTFAFGGNITPTTYNSNPYASSANVNAGGEWSLYTYAAGGYHQYARLGTFFLDNDPTSPYYGDVVRRSNLANLDNPDAMAYGTTKSGNNTFNLYLQITPNHQLSYYYLEGYTFQNINGAFNMGDSSPEYGQGTSVHAWNVSYKAVLGASGILDARYGRSQNYRDQPKAGKESVQIKTYGSLWAYDGPKPPLTGSGNIIDFSQYYANGMIDSYWNAHSEYNRRPFAYFNILGLNTSGSNGSGVNSMNLNYQHMMEYKGQHLIDIGFNREAADAEGIPPEAKEYYSPVGQIAFDLTSSQIGNLYGHPVGPVSRYAGKFIVFDVGTATVRDLEPHVFTRPNYNGVTLIDPGDGVPIWVNGGINPIFGGLLPIEALPTLKEYYGNSNGNIYTTQSSFYINDLWSINEHHVLMLGLRADMFNLSDDMSTVHKYTKITPRSEYKYDMFGDQKHLFVASYAQFHQMANMNLYWPFAEKKWGNYSSRLWTGDKVDPIKKQKGYYLVDLADVMNPGNYGIEYAFMNSGKEAGNVDKGFKPPTSTEYSLWYRRAFNNGGYIKVTFDLRTYADLYDYFPGEVYAYTPPTGGAPSNRLRVVLKNTNEFSRTYKGLELQWDFPISRKVIFGGNYTFSSFWHNQSAYGSSTSAPSGSAASFYELQNLEWFDSKFAEWGGRSAWMPEVKVGNEFTLSYYLIVNLTQGQARSNFTLRGTYTGSSLTNDVVRVEVGYPVYSGINAYPGGIGTGGNQMVNYKDIPFNPYTTYDTFYNNFTYNLTLPLVKRLSWFLNINVNNIFNHIPKIPQIPGGRNTGLANYRPWPIQNGVNAQGEPTYLAATANPYADGWLWSGNAQSYFIQRNTQRRSISMSTGIRF